MQHTIRIVLALALANALAACGSTEGPKELARLGTACQKAAECGSGLCLHGVCTRGCTAQGDCPESFDCTLSDPFDPSGFCLKANWTSPATGGYGTNCGASAGGCGGANPCAEGFTCHADAKCDPKSYCTKGCAADADCPPAFFCGQDDKDAPKQCLRRTACAPCGADDQCPVNHVCAVLPSGEHYCAKSCAVEGDCLKPNKDSNSGKPLGAPFETCTDEPSGKGKVCTPGHGECHGPSGISGIQGDGQVCSPCRPGHPEDCAKGETCFEDQSGERFCTEGCTAKATKTNSGYNITNDSCPEGSFCFFGGAGALSGCGSSCNITRGLCTSDYGNTSCYPLQ